MRKLMSLVALACVSGLMGCCHDTCDSCRDICGCGPHGGHVAPAPCGGVVGGPVGGAIIVPGPGAAPMPAPSQAPAPTPK